MSYVQQTKQAIFLPEHMDSIICGHLTPDEQKLLLYNVDPMIVMEDMTDKHYYLPLMSSVGEV